MPKHHYIFLAQGIYYFITGLWPLIDIESFLYITGPKTDLWLVKTVSAIFVCIGLVLSLAFFQQSTSLLIIILGVTTALAIVIIDFYYSLNGVISPVYLIDGGIQILLLLFYSFSFKATA
jgi:hypothetical protein